MKIDRICETPEDFREELKDNYTNIAENMFVSGKEGYWSNLDKRENQILADILKNTGAQDAIRQHYPHLFSIIFSPKRQAGLELLDLSGRENCIDYGCMWGALTIPLAKRCNYVLGIDQTLDSLQLLKARIREEKLDNIDLLCGNLKNLKNFRNKFDIAVINGVLEWIPEEGAIELKNYYGQYQRKGYAGNPRNIQLSFLKAVYQNLNAHGKLYLAIENSLDFKMFFGAKDPHADLLFVSFLPRKMADWVSKMKLGRPYINWLYSFQGIKKLLHEAGFSRIELSMCFPDYRFPERIIPYSGSFKNFSPTISLANEMGKKSARRFFARLGEYLIFKTLRLKYLAPSIIAIGHK